MGKHGSHSKALSMNPDAPHDKAYRDAQADQAFTSEGGYVAHDADEASSPSDRIRLMTQHSIHYDGRRYRYGDYRYDRLADAIAYSRLMTSRYLTRSGGATVIDESIELPDAPTWQLMADLSISLKGGMFTFDGFRYDQLSDAVNHARLRRRREAYARARID